LIIRPGSASDVRLLRDMLRHAYYWRTSYTEFPITRYVNGWGRPGDRALIAIDEFHPVGAAWYRLYSTKEPGFGFVDEQTPELTIGVVPARRGKGIGSGLLDALLERAQADGFARISLSVEKTNPAVHLYESRGFRPVQENGDYVMVADLTPVAA
jgi:ribosomal protein S18 acetylase RimI-like enzyme